MSAEPRQDAVSTSRDTRNRAATLRRAREAARGTPRRPARPGVPFPAQAELEAALARIPALRRGLFRRVYSGKAPRSQAIKAKCLECCGFEDLARRVRECPCRECPIWGYRPYRHAAAAVALDRESHP